MNDEDVNEPWHPSVINVNQYRVFSRDTTHNATYSRRERGINREFSTTIGFRSNEASRSPTEPRAYLSPEDVSLRVSF